MKRKVLLFILFCFVSVFSKKEKFRFNLVNTTKNNSKYGGHLIEALLDITDGFANSYLTVIYDSYVDEQFLEELSTSFYLHEITTIFFNITTLEQQEKYFNHLDYLIHNHLESQTIHICDRKLNEHVLLELQERNFIRRNLIYMFYWGDKPLDDYFVSFIKETMRTVIITNPRYNAYRLYYNQGTSDGEHRLTLVNWWIAGFGLYQHPTLPPALSVYKDFKKRLINVPVIHKPPWHFVKYFNAGIEVLGGRDDKLLRLLSQKLNFRYDYFDPPDRSQGISFNVNGSFEGVLGLLWERETEFFLGDVAVTLERSRAVEFSFLTLADTGAFITHAPRKLNEALALVYPFQWQVWPAIIVSFLVTGPILYLLIALPNAWQPRFLIKSHARLLFDCLWYSTSIFLRQTGKELSSNFKVRLYIVLISFSTTYVICDMYSANLTSLLARPGREKAINNLQQLERAIGTRDFQLFVERHSSTYSLLENGTGVYGRLWTRMNENQDSFLVDSVEEGVKMVKDLNNVAVIAGRETLFFDIQRFGPNYFHLSEKLNTAYSAIAFQIGCPYIENFNKILMAIFEAGILTKMTENEYEKLEKQKPDIATTDTISTKENRNSIKATEENERLEPINLRMIQGAFYLLLIGYGISSICLVFEKYCCSKYQNCVRKLSKKLKNVNKVTNKIGFWLNKLIFGIRRRIIEKFNEAIINTFDYIE